MPASLDEGALYPVGAVEGKRGSPTAFDGLLLIKCETDSLNRTTLGQDLTLTKIFCCQ